MQYPHGTTIAVTDGRKVRLFRNTGDELHLQLLELPEPDVHGHEDNAVDKRNQEEGFEAAVAAWLNHEVLTGKIAQLFVVAPPRTLGVLRPHYHVALKEKLLG